MSRIEFIVRVFGTGLMFTFNHRDPDITVNNNSAFDAEIKYREKYFTCPHYHTIQITVEDK